MPLKPPTLIYIAGYGRSGSTILGTILGAHPQIHNVGEIRHIFELWSTHDRPCACGASYHDCPFWRDLVNSPEAEKCRLFARNMERFLYLPRLLAGSRDTVEWSQYLECQRRLLLYARERSGKPVILDSSKSAWSAAGRLLALQQLPQEEVYVIHLVRSGLAVTESQVTKGTNRALEGSNKNPRGLALRTIVGWITANAIVTILTRYLPSGRYLRIRYEDFIDEPQSTLSKVAAFTGFDLVPVQQRIASQDHFEIGHIVAGNRLRFQQRVQLRTASVEKQRTQLTGRVRALFWLLGGWLQHYYGY